MGIIELYLIFVLGLGFILKFSNAKDRNKYIFISMFVMFVILALRHKNTGTDTATYINAFERFSKYSFTDIIRIFFNGDQKDPTYYFTGWVFSRLTKEPQLWLAFLSAIFCLVIGILIAKESKAPSLSIVILITLGFFGFSMTGLRQTVAMCILILSYEFIKRKKPIQFILLVLFASLYHNTALVFLIAYPVSHMKLGKYHFFAAIITFVIFILFKNQLRNFLGNILQEERYQGYWADEVSTLTLSGFIIQVCIFTYTVFYYKKAIQNNPDIIVMYNMAFIGLMFQLFSSFIAEFFRISMYFSVFNIILIPEASYCEKRYNIRTLFQLALFFVLLFYMYKDGLSYYEFFWKTTPKTY